MTPLSHHIGDEDVSNDGYVHYGDGDDGIGGNGDDGDAGDER